MKHLIMQPSPTFNYSIPLRSKYSPQHPALNLCYSFNVGDQISHPYRTSGKSKILYIIVFTFLDSRREDYKFWTESITRIQSPLNYP
jgi:hypothetical protein